MPALPLSKAQLSDSSRLKELFVRWQSERRNTKQNSSQEWASEQLGFGQSATSQYLNGKIPLNAEAAAKFSNLLGCSIQDFSPQLAVDIAQIIPSIGQTTSFDNRAVHVQLLSNAGSMGVGTDQHHEDVIVGSIALSPHWIEKEVRPSQFGALRFIHACGDSMTPTFVDGDVLLVDTGARDPSVDGVYVLEAHQRVFIKRVRQRLDGNYEVSSDNPTVKTIDVLDGSHQVDVLGRVVWAWNGKKL